VILALVASALAIARSADITLNVMNYADHTIVMGMPNENQYQEYKTIAPQERSTHVLPGDHPVLPGFVEFKVVNPNDLHEQHTCILAYDPEDSNARRCECESASPVNCDFVETPEATAVPEVNLAFHQLPLVCKALNWVLPHIPWQYLRIPDKKTVVTAPALGQLNVEISDITFAGPKVIPGCEFKLTGFLEAEIQVEGITANITNVDYKWAQVLPPHANDTGSVSGYGTSNVFMLVNLLAREVEVSNVTFTAFDVEVESDTKKVLVKLLHNTIETQGKTLAEKALSQKLKDAIDLCLKHPFSCL